MANELTVNSLRWAIQQIGPKMEASAEELNALDGQLGDGDLGVTMVNGSKAILGKIDELPDDLGGSFLKCAQILMTEGGSSFGTLLATGLMSAAKACKGNLSVSWIEMSVLMGGATEAMARRGRSGLGDKTVLDALEAIRVALEGEEDPQVMLELADRAAADALDQFRHLPAKQGRARIFAEKSVGLDDPGQLAIKRITEALRDAK